MKKNVTATSILVNNETVIEIVSVAALPSSCSRTIGTPKIKERARIYANNILRSPPHNLMKIWLVIRLLEIKYIFEYPYWRLCLYIQPIANCHRCFWVNIRMRSIVLFKIALLTACFTCLAPLLLPAIFCMRCLAFVFWKIIMMSFRVLKWSFCVFKVDARAQNREEMHLMKFIVSYCRISCL